MTTPENLESAVAGVDLVIEAVPEEQALKEDVLARCSAAAPAAAIIASNTSSLPIEGLAGAVRAPGALPRRALVQPAGVDAGHRGDRPPGRRAAIPSSAPSRCCAGSASALPRWPTARASSPTGCRWRCCARRSPAWRKGSRRGWSVDEVVRSTFGFRLPFFGPFLIADMAGLDTYASVFETLERDVGPEFSVPEALRERVDAGRVGTKSGEGFGEYTDAERDALLLERDRRYAALAKLLAELDRAG